MVYLMGKSLCLVGKSDSRIDWMELGDNVFLENVLFLTDHHECLGVLLSRELLRNLTVFFGIT